MADRLTVINDSERFRWYTPKQKSRQYLTVLNGQGCEVSLELEPKYLILGSSAWRTFWQDNDLLMAYQ